MKPYHINLFFSAEDGGWIADVPDLKFCSAFGETREEALAEVRTAMDGWLASARKLQTGAKSHLPTGNLSSGGELKIPRLRGLRAERGAEANAKTARSRRLKFKGTILCIGLYSLKGSDLWPAAS